MNKSNIFILHSLNGDTLEIWWKDVKEHFDLKGIETFMPQFPIRAESSFIKFNEILTKYLENGTLNENSIIICHSIGNPYFIKFCKFHNFIPKNIIAVAPGAIYPYPMTRTDYIVEVKNQAYLTKEEFEFGKNFKNVYLLNSSEDDKNPEKFTRFEKDFNTKSFYLKGYNHFDGYHRIYKLPELINLIEEIIWNKRENLSHQLEMATKT